MSAVKHCNLRMVKRLLQLGVDPTLTDASGNNALHFLRETRRNKEDADEIRSLVQSAILRTEQQNLISQSNPNPNPNPNLTVESSNSGNNAEMEVGTDGEFVFDVYCVSGISGMDNGTSQEPGSAEMDVASSDPSVGPVPLRVDGLRILDGQGHVELSLEGAYDSDWSDLGDDEEPDSNDERFHGNDSPDEEEDEGGPGDGDDDEDEREVG